MLPGKMRVGEVGEEPLQSGEAIDRHQRDGLRDHAQPTLGIRNAGERFLAAGFVCQPGARSLAQPQRQPADCRFIVKILDRSPRKARQRADRRDQPRCLERMPAKVFEQIVADRDLLPGKGFVPDRMKRTFERGFGLDRLALFGRQRNRSHQRLAIDFA